MLNRVEFIGNLGADPECRTFQDGGKVTNIRIACTEKWKKDGETRENTEWVSCALFGPLADIAERYLKKGSKVYVAGKWSTRKWTDQSGNDRYSTECVLRGYDAKLVMLDGPSQSDNRGGAAAGGAPSGGAPGRSDYDDAVPFAPEWRV